MTGILDSTRPVEDFEQVPDDPGGRHGLRLTPGAVFCGFVFLGMAICAGLVIAALLL